MKVNIRTFDIINDNSRIEEIFATCDVLNWQTTTGYNGHIKITIEWKAVSVKITENTCLVCLTNDVDLDCNIVMSWNGREERADTFTCMICWDEICSNYHKIKNSPKMTELDNFWN